MKAWTCAAVLLLLGNTACNRESSVTEFKEDSDATAKTKALSPLETILSAGLAMDFNEQAHSERKNWLAKNLLALAETKGSLDSSAAQPCQLELQEQGQTFVLVLNENSAYPLPTGRIVFCRSGKLGWAGQDRELLEKTLQAGATSQEIEKIAFYRVPIEVPNSFSSLNSLNEGAIVIFDGVAQSSRQNSLDVESVTTGLLLHELGQINEFRKTRQSQLKAAQDRLKAACKASSRGDNTPYASRLEGCRKSLGAISRPWKYAADQFVIDVLARKKYAQTLKPGELAKFFRVQTATGRDPLDAHPDGVERGIQFERNLDSVGLSRLTENTP